MTITHFKLTYSINDGKLFKIAISLIYINFWIFGIHPLRKKWRIYEVVLLFWCVEIIWTTHLAIIHDVFGDEQSLDGFVSVILYFTHMLGHLVVLVESYIKNPYCSLIFQQFIEIKKYLKIELMKPQNLNYNILRFSIIILGIFIMLTICHGLIMWTTFETRSAASLLYWRSLQSYLALQIKTLELLTTIIQLNYYVSLLRKTLNDMGEEQEDEQMLIMLKKAYNEIYMCLKTYNDTYGWSLLFSTAVYFVDFVCNTYWIILAILTQGRDYYALLQNACFAILAFVLLSIICWFSEECYYESRYVGCLISKLVKPLGNKRYNDLVSEFSIQTLHERFVVSAKDFFSLNLSLLGSMVAAIVTYLVILIQFMFTEKTNNENRVYWKCNKGK
ncbi:gustatory receptor 23a-like [Cochliomyia hominivorax]